MQHFKLMWCLWLFSLSTDATGSWKSPIKYPLCQHGLTGLVSAFDVTTPSAVCLKNGQWYSHKSKTAAPFEVSGATWHTCKHGVCCCTTWHVLFPTFWELCVAYQIRRLISCAQKLISSGDVDVCTQSLAPYEISVLGGGLSACTDVVHE